MRKSNKSLSYGTPGKTLRNKLVYSVLVLVLGLALAFALGRLTPLGGGFGLFLALLVFLRLFSSDREVQGALRAKLRGYAGEARVGQILESLPAGWRVYHDLDLGGENVDHLVLGPGGAFNVEVKNYSGRILARPDGLYRNGQRLDGVVRQAWRQAHKLKALLGVEVTPILVFVGGQVEGERAGRLLVKRPEELPAFLQGLPRIWTYEAFLEVARKAEGLVK